MLIVVGGELKEAPILREFSVGEKNRTFSSAYVYVDSANEKDRIEVKVIAKEELASELQCYKAGDEIQFIAEPNDTESANITVLGFHIIMIDHSKSIIEKQDQLFQEYLD